MAWRRATRWASSAPTSRPGRLEFADARAHRAPPRRADVRRRLGAPRARWRRCWAWTMQWSEAVCREASRAGAVVVPANYNSPGQIVISGDLAAVARAEELLKEAGAKRVLAAERIGRLPLAADGGGGGRAAGAARRGRAARPGVPRRLQRDGTPGDAARRRHASSWWSSSPRRCAGPLRCGPCWTAGVQRVRRARTRATC